MTAEIKIKYVSLLAQAQEAVSASAMERTFSFAGNLSAVAQDVMDNFDTDEAARNYADILGNNPGILREPSEVQRIRRERADRIAAQEAAALANEGAQAAKTLSEADTQNPNALTDLLQRGNTVV